MVLLSEVRRCDLVDGQGRRARLRDLAVDLSTGDYPTVTRLVVRWPDREQRTLPWAAVEATDWRARRVRVADLAAAKPADPGALERAVLLRRDIVDALVLDLGQRSALRANDLELREEGGRLVLSAADVGALAVLRRLFLGRLGLRARPVLHDWKEIEFLRGDIEAARSGADYHRRIAHLPPGQIANLTEAVPYLHAAELLTLLPDPVAADVLEAMTAERQLQVFEELDEAQASSLLALMAPNVAADLVGRLQPEEARRALERLPAPRRERVIDLLRYPADTAAGIMTNDVVTAPPDLTVGEARRTLADRLRDPDFVYFVYVVDDEASRRLRGVLTLRDLLVAEEGRRLEEVMYRHLVTVHALEPADAAAQRVTDSHLAALPVVGREGRLLGAITVDAAIAQIAPQAWSAQAPRVFS